jgi:hypothetical protein
VCGVGWHGEGPFGSMVPRVVSGVLGVFARQPLAAGFAGWVAGQGGGCLVALGKRSVTAGVAGGIGLSLTRREPISTRLVRSPKAIVSADVVSNRPC